MPVRFKLSAREVLIPQLPKCASVGWNDSTSTEDSPHLERYSFRPWGELGLHVMTAYILLSGSASCKYSAFSLHWRRVHLVSALNSVSPVKGSSLPRAGRAMLLVEVEHLNRSNQSSSISLITAGGCISFPKHLPYLCLNILVVFKSAISSSVYFVDRVPFFNAHRSFS